MNMKNKIFRKGCSLLSLFKLKLNFIVQEEIKKKDISKKKSEQIINWAVKNYTRTATSSECIGHVLNLLLDIRACASSQNTC